VYFIYFKKGKYYSSDITAIFDILSKKINENIMLKTKNAQELVCAFLDGIATTYIIWLVQFLISECKQL